MTEELSSYSDAPSPSVTRVLYTNKVVLTQRHVKNLMALAGLSVREDAGWFGAKYLPAVATGSHIDAIPYSRKCDGVVGALGATEAINVLEKVGVRTEEVSTRFGISCLESRLLAGSKELAEALKTTVVDGQNLKVEFEGNGGQVGAVLMPYNPTRPIQIRPEDPDAQTYVLESESIDTLGTVGNNEQHSDRTNLILIRTKIFVLFCFKDSRYIDEARRNTVIKKIQESANAIARKVKLTEFKIVNQDPPALSSKLVIKKMAEASTELNLSHKMMMISRAYHDSLFMARISPMGIIFIPCYKGYSHKPEEYSSPEDMANGVNVLSLTLAKLSLD
ncbi:hypothetical protein Bca52824_030565 [Brassica carinata]|uniref:Uncharacterized protein n=1 Tax=Brassica carinata TaxID=52824 RepID=A0A8X7SDF3_BRACI|nr:hypothetical protein Bca52824_030565 [Brassica carinata]